MQRRLISALEDLKLMEDGSVRNTAGNIIQFKYGEDGSDPTRSVKGKSIDLNNLFVKVFGDDADRFLKLDTKDVGDDYGSKEKDEMNSVSEDDESDGYEEPDGLDFEGE